MNCSLDYLVGRDGSHHSPQPVQDNQDEQSADKANFLTIMSDLYDKYFKLPTPSALFTLSTAETIDADASVDIHSVKSDVANGTDETRAADGCTEKQVAVKALNNVIKPGKNRSGSM